LQLISTVNKENEVALQQAEMRMVRWMCGIKLKDRVPSKELRERLEFDNIILVLQQNRLRWYGHVLQKEDNHWVKKYVGVKWSIPDPEVDQRKLGQRLCKKTVRHINCNRWRKQIKDD